MENNNLVCLCNGVSKDEIISEVKKGVSTLKEIKENTNAGTGICCGIRCKRNIKQIIKEYK